MRKKRAPKNYGRGSVDLQVGLGPKIKLHENGPWDGVTAGLAMLSALHGLKPGPEQAEYNFWLRTDDGYGCIQTKIAHG